MVPQKLSDLQCVSHMGSEVELDRAPLSTCIKRNCILKAFAERMDGGSLRRLSTTFYQGFHVFFYEKSPRLTGEVWMLQELYSFVQREGLPVGIIAPFQQLRILPTQSPSEILSQQTPEIQAGLAPKMCLLQSMLAREASPSEKGRVVSVPSLLQLPVSLPWKQEGAGHLSQGRVKGLWHQLACNKTAVGYHQRPGFGIWIHRFESRLNYLSNCMTSDISLICFLFLSFLNPKWEEYASSFPTSTSVWCGQKGKGVLNKSRLL